MLTEKLTQKFTGKGPGAKRVKSRAFLWIGSIVIGLVSFAGIWALQAALVGAKFYPFIALQGVVYDRGMTVHARAYQAAHAEPGDVVVVEVKESTLQNFEGGLTGLVPGVAGTHTYSDHPRVFHTRLLQNLTRWGAKTVVFDMVFGAPQPQFDRAFAEAIRAHGNVILAASQERSVEAGGQGEVTSLTRPTADLREAAAGIGVANIDKDVDQALRQFTWWYKSFDEDTLEDANFPALGVAAAAQFKGEDPKALLNPAPSLQWTFLGHPVRWTDFGASRASFIRYYGEAGFPSGKNSVIQYEQVVKRGQDELDDERLRKLFSGKLVFVGDATLLGQDVHRVPVISSSQGLGDSQNMAGVEVQAHAAQTLLTGQYPAAVSTVVNALLVLGACLLAVVLGRLFTPTVLVPVVGVLIALFWFGSIHFLANANVWWEPVTASVGLVTAAAGETAFMFVAERKQREKAKRQLSRHVGRGVAEKLTDDEWPDLSGETREISMLFSDLQGFTSLSENMTSPEICSLLNRYFEVIFPILFKHGGSLDKLMGDGMMAYFGWPVRQHDHAARAIRCAIEMQQALEEWQRQPEFAGAPPLRTRVGIHTGAATVGEIGALDRVGFTVIGDVVNVASRLEGMNKDFGTTILISDATRSSAGEIVPMTHRGVATVRGRKEPMPVYSVDSATSTGRQRTGRTGSASFQVTDTQSGS